MGGGVNDWLSAFSCTQLNAMINGNIAVQFFFLLSGFFVALTVFSYKGPVNFASKAVKRYLRLLPMIAAATVFTYILMKTGLLFHLVICDKVANESFLLDYCNFVPTIKSLLYNIFVRPFIFNSEYVGPFWYIKPEFWGYLMTLAICIVAKGYRWRRLGYCAVLIILWWNNMIVNYSSFILGIMLADLYFYTNNDTTYFSKFYNSILNHRWFTIASFLGGSYLAMIPLSLSEMYQWLPFTQSGIWQFETIDVRFYRALGLAISLWGIINLRIVQKIFEFGPLLWMGKVSFATYAFHWPVMLSLEACLFGFFIGLFSYDTAALLAFAITLPVIYLLSYIATRYLDKPIKLNNICQYSKIRHC